MTEAEIIANIQKIQTDIQSVADAQKKKIMAIEKSYNEQLQVEYEKRDTMISKSGVPNFWGNVLTRAFIDMFDSMDQQVVEYIEDFKATISFSDDNTIHKNYTITFKENPYFSNKSLTKTLSMGDNDEIKSVPPTIQWKEQSQKKPEKSNNNKKRKDESNIKENSFILNLLKDEETPELFDELMRIYQDPFSILMDEDEEEGGDFFDEEEGEDDGEEEEEEEEAPKAAQPKKKNK